MTRIGLLPSGGDSPGVNALIRALVLRGTRDYGDEFVGFVGGWRGVLDAEALDLDEKAVRGVSRLGGTMLGCSSAPPDHVDVPTIRARLRALAIEALVVVGDSSALDAAAALHENGVRVVGVPASLENDVGGIDCALGFATAVEVAAESIDRLRTAGDAHNRSTIAEVVGQRAGWIALHAGAATDAHAVLVPEFPQNVGRISEWVRRPMRRGRSPLIVVSEGFRLLDDSPEKGATEGWSIGPLLARRMETELGVRVTSVVLGGMQRGAAPVAADRVLAVRLGNAAIETLHAGRWGSVVATRGSEMVTRALQDLGVRRRVVSRRDYADVAAALGRRGGGGFPTGMEGKPAYPPEGSRP